MTGTPTWTWAVPLIASGLALLGVSVTLFLQNRNFKRQIRSAHALKVAEMRQAWINNLRDAMAMFQSWGVNPASDQIREREFYESGTRIELFMNPNDVHYKELHDLMYEFLAADEIIEKFGVNARYIDVCQRILKKEWGVLKAEVDSAAR